MDVLALDQKDAVSFAPCIAAGMPGAPSATGIISGSDTQAQEQIKMEFADVIDDAALADSAACDNEDDGARHRIVPQTQAVNSRSAATNRSSFSRPCEATRMWKRSMPTLLEQSRTYMP